MNAFTYWLYLKYVLYQHILIIGNATIETYITL